jgi:hypothetical protein
MHLISPPDASRAPAREASFFCVTRYQPGSLRFQMGETDMAASKRTRTSTSKSRERYRELSAEETEARERALEALGYPIEGPSLRDAELSAEPTNPPPKRGVHVEPVRREHVEPSRRHGRR